MAGLISNALTPPSTIDAGNTASSGVITNNQPAMNTVNAPTGNQVTQAGSVGYNPTSMTVDPNTMTVAGQMSKLLDAGSPYITAAKSGAMETANDRGLLNSSIAAGAGESAAINAALPIAQSDAGTYTGAGVLNTQATNAALASNAGATNTAANLNAANANASSLQQLRGTQSVDLANIEANYKTLMQTSASAASTFNVATQQISAILADPNTSAAQKQAAVDKQTSLLQNSMQIIGSIANVDLTGLLDFSSLNAPATAAAPAQPTDQNSQISDLQNKIAQLQNQLNPPYTPPP